MKNKVLLITGGAVRIGEALVRFFHAKNFNIAFSYHQSEKAALLLQSDLNQTRDNSALALMVDLTKTENIASFTKQVLDKYERADLLINNASSFYPTEVGTITIDNWHDLMTTNCLSPLLISQQLAPHLTKNGGSIINIIDIHAKQPMPRHVIYSIAKAGLLAQTKSLALELAPKVRVNGISPGTILWPSQNTDPATKPENIIERTPMNRIGTTLELCDSAYFLHSSEYITGHVITLDGGRHLVI